MFGPAGEIMRTQFTFKNAQNGLMSNDDLYKNNNIFSYIMEKCLYHTKQGQGYQDASLLNNLFTIHVNKPSKYENLKKVNENMFLSDKHKTEFMELFSQTQKTYLALDRLAFIWKYKKAVQGNSMDMMMNDIRRGERGVVEVYQAGSIFLFRTQEVNRIVENSICDNEYMFASPKPVKNPFNNLPFTKANLYTMYLGIDKMYITKMPIIFYKYFLTGFNLKEFYEQNHALIREKGIQDYLKNSDNDDLYDDVIDMLDYVKTYSARRVSFDISDECCKCCIVKIMKPYLQLYLTHKHSLNKYEIKQSFYSLRYKLFQLFEHNPTFGRKIMVKQPAGLDNKVKFKATYSLDHPSNQVTFDKDAYKEQHLDTTFVDQDDYPSYELSQDEPVRDMDFAAFTRLYEFARSTSVQNINLSVNPPAQTESTSSDSDDETVVEPYSAPINSSSDIEDGEIPENSEDDGSVEIDYVLDYIGDASMNTITQEDEETKEDEESFLNTLNDLCLNLDSELDENPDNRDNNE
jgi:hypothetical protein